MISVHTTLQPGVEITFFNDIARKWTKIVSICFPNECEKSRMLHAFLKSQINLSLSFKFKQLAKVCMSHYILIIQEQASPAIEICTILKAKKDLSGFKFGFGHAWCFKLKTGTEIVQRNFERPHIKLFYVMNQLRTLCKFFLPIFILLSLTALHIIYWFFSLASASRLICMKIILIHHVLLGVYSLLVFKNLSAVQIARQTWIFSFKVNKFWLHKSLWFCRVC